MLKIANLEQLILNNQTFLWFHNNIWKKRLVKSMDNQLKIKSNNNKLNNKSNNFNNNKEQQYQHLFDNLYLNPNKLNNFKLPLYFQEINSIQQIVNSILIINNFNNNKYQYKFYIHKLYINLQDNQ
ncbi:hypothetical protein FGO68_gene6865 [Halteria grandinella]|uniref:Uncharacterized protein n=1 Tax=Halteria grandinella TaxID=5974 RepID=A0A8J8SV21_HALGN|nr:hypothetical protein FGO68_gene6865 [Halteria grandinella]